MKLREDPAEGYYIGGLRNIQIETMEDFKKLLKLGEKARHYRQTDVHEHSSRSHTICRVLLENRMSETRRTIVETEQENEKKSAAKSSGIEEIEQKHISFGTKYSVFNLVDLAGSERLAESGSSSLQETSHINTSLFTLTKVINKLSE